MKLAEKFPPELLRAGSPVCPRCGEPALRIVTEHGTKFQCCDLWSWGYSPLVDQATHNARKDAHDSFDILWKAKMMTRAEAYSWLAKKMDLPLEQCHIKLFNVDQCADVEEEVENYIFVKEN